jgi:uncharacterized membrane protein affecting hemolysin expression
MRLPRMTTRRWMILVTLIGLMLALAIQERRATRRTAELAAAYKKLQSYHEFTRQLARGLLRSEEALKGMAGAKASAP